MSPRITFEPGDGSFEVTIGPDDPIPADWNIRAAAILRETEPGTFKVIKPLGDLFTEAAD